MRFSFCKNSVFCAIFLVLFFLGTICGIFLLRCVLVANSDFLSDYCLSLRAVKMRSPWLLLWFHLLPFLSAFAVSFLPNKDKFLFVLIFLRGCVSAYAISACYALGLSLANILVRDFLLLPVFYWFCRKLWSVHFHWNL